MASIIFWRIYLYGLSKCPPYVFTMIIKQQYLEHKILYITVNLDKSVVDITLLGSCSNGVISIDFVTSKDNLANMFTKDLSGERINCASREMGLKPNHTELA